MASNIPRGLALAIASLICSCAPVSTAKAPESITVSRKPWFGVCAGVCPAYAVTLSADDDITAENYWTKSVTRFHVTHAEAEHFRSLLRPYRPAVSTEVEPICFHNVRPEEADLVLKVREIEIVWSGPGHPSRLVACEGAVIDETLRQALWTVHLYVTATPRPN